MPKITYQELRPGDWFRLVDGKIVRPATAAEVAAWKQEKAAPARIWDDVIATASRPPLGEVKVTKPPAAKTETPAGTGARHVPDQSVLWEDLVKRTKPSVQAKGPLKPAPHQKDIGPAEGDQIWQDVVKRSEKPSPRPEPARVAPVSNRAAPQVKPGPAVKAAPVPAAAPRAVSPSPAARRPDEGTTTRKAFAAEVASSKLVEKLKPSATVESEQKGAPVKAPSARPVPKPTGPVVREAKAEVKPARAPARAQKTSPAEPSSALKAPAAKTAPEKPATKPARKAESAKVAARSKKAAPARRGKPKVRLPAKLLDEIEVEETAPAVEPRDEVVIPRRTARRTATSRPGGTESSAARAKARAAQERPNQLYLWIIAAQSDDLLITLRTGLARYQERFSHPAEVVLCHSGDLPALEGAKLPIDLREGKGLAPRNFWIGLK